MTRLREVWFIAAVRLRFGQRTVPHQYLDAAAHEHDRDLKGFDLELRDEPVPHVAVLLKGAVIGQTPLTNVATFLEGTMAHHEPAPPLEGSVADIEARIEAREAAASGSITDSVTKVIAAINATDCRPDVIVSDGVVYGEGPMADIIRAEQAEALAEVDDPPAVIPTPLGPPSAGVVGPPPMSNKQRKALDKAARRAVKGS